MTSFFENVKKFVNNIIFVYNSCGLCNTVIMVVNQLQTYYTYTCGNKPSLHLHSKKNKYFITYFDNNNNEYKVLLNKNRRTKKMYIDVYDGVTKEKITDEVNKWCGPYHDFHSQPITPDDMGYTSMIFETVGCEKLIFNQFDLINLTP